MPPLPLNLGVDALLRRRVIAALFAAPAILALAAYIPFVLLDNWVKREAGMRLGADIGDHPNVAILEPLFSVAFVLFPALGYVLGWCLNAIVLLCCAGWRMPAVRSALLRSEVPTSWLHHRIRSPGQLAGLREEFAQWAAVREVGALRYILREGVLKVGFGFFVVLSLARVFRGDEKLNSLSWASMLVLSLVIGAAITTIVWYWGEHRFAYREQLLNEA